MHTNLPNHEPSFLMMNSGETQPTRPSMGSWLTYGLGSENQNLPGYVVLCPGQPTVGPQLWSNSFLPGIYQGVHINNGELDPRKVIKHITNPHVTPADQRRQLDLLRKINQTHLADRPRDPQLEARIQALEMAFRMQTEAQEAFDISRETKETRKLYGEGEFANACLIARRLAERGVRMVQVYFGGGQPWDDHGDIQNHRQHAPRATRRSPGCSPISNRAACSKTRWSSGGANSAARRRPKGRRGATTTTWASACGWPAAA